MGCAICPVGALVNHSCEPNVVIVFPRSGPKKDEPNLQVIAIRDIQIGEEVCKKVSNDHTFEGFRRRVCHTALRFVHRYHATSRGAKGRAEDDVRFYMQLFGMFKARPFRGHPLCRGLSKSVWRHLCSRERYIRPCGTSNAD